jgi:hypothetical protein
VHIRSVIAKSDQIWKVIVGLSLLVIGAAVGLCVSSIPYLRTEAVGSGEFNILQAVSTAAAAAGFVYLCTRIRCPRCGAKWVWMAVNGKLGARSLDALATLDRCPTCGYGGYQLMDGD